MGHKHADAMAQYAEDAKHHAEPWKLWEFQVPGSNKWVPMKAMHPIWLEHFEYRRKPRTININGHEVPEPLRVGEVSSGEEVYIPCLQSNSLCAKVTFFQESGTAFRCLCRGMLHSTKEAARAHADALLSFTRGV